MPDPKEIAYIREYPSKTVDIRFFLNFETPNGESVSQEITGFAKSEDALSSLKRNIQEKITELNDESKENENNIPLKLPNSLNNVEVVFRNHLGNFKENIRIVDFYNNLNKKCTLIIHGQKFPIIKDAPIIRQLRLPASIVANYTVVPAVMKTHNMHKESSEYIWYRSLDKEVWEKIGDEHTYRVRTEDVGYYLKLCCTPYSIMKIEGPVVEAVSEHKVDIISEIPLCPFEARHELTKQKLKGNKLRVVSYNVLADRYVDPVTFSYCPPKALGIHYRKQLIIKELLGYNADIICLQEVDEYIYKSFYQNRLSAEGYKCIFNRKGNCIPEGLVIAFRVNRFKVIDTKHLILRGSVDRKVFREVKELLDGNKEVKQEFLKQNTSVQCTVLQDKETSKFYVIGNTHLFYHPDANHIRLLQAFMALLQLTHIRNRVASENRTHNVATIFCGDFNSDYSEKSLYGFMKRGTIDPADPDCLKISPSGDATLYHKLQLISACGTPKYTNYTEDYKGCLDYIFIDRSKLSVIKNIPVPSEQDLSKYVGLPNEVYPSDHVALVVDLQYNSR